MSRSTANLIAGLLALALTAGLVIRTSSAVFTAQTDNSGNSLEAGTIALSDDDSGAAALTMTNIAPGEYSQRCIRVLYEGTLDPEPVKVYSTSVFAPSVADMEDQVNITIEQGAAGSGGSFTTGCAGFTPGVTLVDAVPLSTWHGAATSYTTGNGTWNPTGPNQARIYRITLELDLSTGNAYQGASLGGINLTWETQSTPTGGLVP